MPDLHPKLILNMLPGTHSLHPNLAHEAYACLLPSTPKCDTERASWHAFPSPQTGTRSLCSHYFLPPQTKRVPIYTCLTSTRNWYWTCFLARIPGLSSKLVHEACVVSTFLHPKLVPIYTCVPCTRYWYWTCFLARIPFTPNWYTTSM